MDVVMDMVVLEVEVMRSVRKKREEGSGHRIDWCWWYVGDGHDHTKDGDYNRGLGSEMFKCYLWSAVRGWNHSSAHLKKLSSVQGIRGEVTPQPTFTGWPSISTKHEALNPSPRIFCNLWFCASIRIRERVKKIDYSFNAKTTTFQESIPLNTSHLHPPHHPKLFPLQTFKIKSQSPGLSRRICSCSFCFPGKMWPGKNW